MVVFGFDVGTPVGVSHVRLCQSGQVGAKGLEGGHELGREVEVLARVDPYEDLEGMGISDR